MKSLIATLVLFFVFNCYPQADLTINLFLHDNELPPYGGSSIISFGLDSTATDGIDSHLGELQYPPDICPTWWPYFCAKFLLPPFNGYLDSPKDFRFGELPFTGQKEHRIFCVSDDTIITIEYNLPSGVTLNLSDVFGGVLFTETLTDSGEITLPYVYFFSGQIRMFVDYDNVIPVELVSFNGEQIDDLVFLDWKTATEFNNSGFEIQKLQDYKIEKLKDWEAIGFVAGFGTTTEPKSYSFFDENVTSGTYKYRLKQIDFDGSFTYSNEIEVEIDFTPKEFVLYQNYPNPFNPNTKIKYTIPKVETHLPAGRQGRDASLQMVTLKVYDVLGKEVATLVNEEKQPGAYEVKFSVGQDSSPDLASGIYFYQLLVSALHSKDGKAGSFTNTKKMILMK